jgi:hypothetical protein
MLQTCDVGMLYVARNKTRNMGRLGVVPWGREELPDVRFCTQNARNMAHNGSQHGLLHFFRRLMG